MNGKIAFLLFGFLLLAACESGRPKPPSQQETASLTPAWSPPPPGEVVAEYRERMEDRLNENYLLIQVKSTPESPQGVYELHLNYGHNQNVTDLEMPEWIEGVHLKPEIRRRGQEQVFDLGFQDENGQFREYFVITIQRGDIHLRMERAYYLTPESSQ